MSAASEASLPRISKQPRPRPARDKAGRVFSCLGDLLAFHGRTAPGRAAILAPDGVAGSYGDLLAHTNAAVRALRSLGIGPSDRVAVILPSGPDAAVAIVAVASGAVCVPLNPGYTADEWQGYFGDLQITALLTRADINSPSRGVAHALGIPVIDMVPREGEGPGAFSLVGSAKGRAARAGGPALSAWSARQSGAPRPAM